jgi:hypothetical protein
MLFKRKPISTAALATLLIITSLHSCKVDDWYSFDKIKNVDTEVTLFENGISIPLVQNTAKITVDSILRLTGIDTTAFGEYLKVGDNGNYFLSYENKFSLTDAINDLDLQNMVDIDAVSYTQSVSYNIGSLDASSLSTDEKNYSYSEKLMDFSFDIADFQPTGQHGTLFTQTEVKNAAVVAQKAGLSTVTLPATTLPFSSDDKAVVSGVKLSSHIQSVETIYLKAGSAIKVDVSIPGCIFTSGEITPEVKVELGDLLTFKGGSTLLDCSSLVLGPANSYKASGTYEVASLNGAKIAQDKKLTLTGSVKCSDLQTSVSEASAVTEDIAVNVEISFVDFELDSAYGQIVGFTYDIDDEDEKISYDLPDDIGNFGTFTVIPKGSPALTLVIDIPEIEGVKVVSEDGILVNVPSFIRFCTVPAGLEYDEKASTLLVSDIKKATYSLPISKFVITPKKSGDKYVFEDTYSVEGSAGLPDGRYDIAKLLPAAGKEMSVNATIPAIEAQSIQLDELAIDIDESTDMELIGAADIPEIVKGLGTVNLDAVKAQMDIDLKNLPDIGEGQYSVELRVRMPDFVNPSSFQIYGQIVDGKYSKTVDIKNLDFSDLDFEKLRADGSSIGGEVTITGKVMAEDPTVDVSTLTGEVTGEVNIRIAGADDKIRVKDLTAQVDYQIDSTMTVPFFTLPEALADANLDLPDAQLVAEVTSNLAIPMSAQLDLNDGMYTFPIKFPYSEDPAQSMVEANEFSIDLNPLITSGKEELPVVFNLNVSPDTDTHIYTDAEYGMDVNLTISVPVQFGEEFTMNYADTLDLGTDAGTLREILRQSEIQLYGKVESTLPYRVSVNLELLKYDSGTGTYSVIETEEPIAAIITEPETTGDFALIIKSIPEEEIEGLSHLRFSFDLGANGAVLNEDSFILLHGLGIKAPQGITVNIGKK